MQALVYSLLLMSASEADPTFSTEPIFRCPDGTVIKESAKSCPKLRKRSKSRPARPANNVGRWVTTNDYPTAALMVRAEGTTRILLTVGKKGEVQDCEVTSSSGNSALDAAACRATTKRAVFLPARDKAGKTTTGSYSKSIRWQIPSITPRNIPKAGRIIQSYIIEEDGSVSNCKYESTPNLEVSRITPCSPNRRFILPTDEDGNPIRKKVAIAVVSKIEDIDDDGNTVSDRSRKARPANDMTRWVTENDYPETELEKKVEDTVKYSLIVGANGRVNACSAKASDGNSVLAKAVCRALRRRARFNPALNRNGVPTVGGWSGSHKWELPK